MQRELNYVVDIGQRIIEQPLNEPLFTHEQNAHAIRVTLLKNGSPVTLSELAECKGYFLHEDTQETDRVDGTVEGNLLTVVIKPTTYLTPGFVRISIEVIDNDESLVVLMLSGTIKITRSGRIIDPTGEALPDLDQLIDKFNELAGMASDVEGWIEDVTATIALPFSDQKAGGYKIGEFVIRNGLLYRCKVDHTGAWVEAHFEATNVANELERVRDEERKARVQLIDSVSYLGTEGPDSLVTLENAANGAPAKAIVTMAPKQDLHGYTKPWAGGAGKNLLPFDIDMVKSLNTSGTWAGNTYTNNGVSFIVDNGQVVVSGTASGNASLIIIGDAQDKTVLAFTLPVTGCKINGVNDGSSSTYEIGVREVGASGVTHFYNESTLNMTDVNLVQIIVRSGYTASDLVISPMIRLASETDATYEPYSNICPITGYDNVTVTRMGKNLLSPAFFSKTTESGGVFTFNATGYTADLMTGQSGSAHVVNDLDKCPIFAPGAYMFSCKHSSGGVFTKAWGVDSEGKRTDVTASSSTDGEYQCIRFTLEKTSRICITRSSNTNPTVFSEPQIEIGESRTAFSLCQGQSITVNVKAANNNNTVYGGTLTINKDGTGTLVVDKVCADASTLTWTTSGITNAFVATGGFPVTPESHLSSELFSGETSWGYAKTNYDQLSSGDYVISWRSPGNNSAKGIAIRDSRLSAHYSSFNLSAFQTAIAGLDILYTIAPQPYTLTASQITTLLGTNHVWSDADSIEVEYTMDTTHKFDAYDSGMSNLSENLSTLAGSIADQDGQFGTADEAHAQGDLFMWGTQLVRAKTAIAINDPIVLDTNVEEATVEEELDGVKEDVSDLKSQMNSLDGQINGSSGGTQDVTSNVVWADTPGGVQYSTGSFVSNLTNCSHADIPLNGATHVSGHTRGGLEPEKGMCFLGTGGTWISGYYNQGGSSYDWNYSFDVPDGAVTLRLCCTTSYIANAFSCILTLPGAEGLEDRVEALEENPVITDYTDLTNKPSINSVMLAGNKSLDDLGIASKGDVDSLEIEINGGESLIDTEIAIADFSQDNFRIMSNGYWASQTNGAYYMQIPAGVISVSIKANASYKTMFAFLSSYSPVSGQKAPVVGNSGNPFEINAGETVKQDVPETATYIWISRRNSSGYDTTPQKITYTTIGTTVGFAEKLNEIEYGNSVTYTGSYYQIREGDFKQGSCWRLLMSETTASVDYVEISALTDKDDTSTAETQFLLHKGKEVLWSPLKNYEAIRYGVNGSCTITINDCTSIFDEIEHRVFYCGPNREYTKLIDAIAAAEQYMGSILYVDAGEYDLVQEFGDDYFSGISAGGMHGVSLKNRIHIVFSPNSYVTCHYTGSNPYVLEDFSPFNCGQYGFTLENLNLSSSRVRYAIHDERNGKTELCLSRYINCKITHDNTDNEEWHSYSCIGGGLGSNHEVVIENCVFESIVESGTAVHGCVSYHPSNDSSNHNFACKLTVKDNYFVTGTLELSGSRTDASIDTVVIFTNNSVEYDSANAASGIYFSGSSGYAGTHYDIRAWNNEIRH